MRKLCPAASASAFLVARAIMASSLPLQRTRHAPDASQKASPNLIPGTALTRASCRSSTDLMKCDWPRMTLMVSGLSIVTVVSSMLLSSLLHSDRRLLECWHHLVGETRQLLFELAEAGAHRKTEEDVFEARIARFNLLEIGHGLCRCTTEPRLLLKDFFKIGPGRDVSGHTARTCRRHLLVIVPQHAERCGKLDVLLKHGLESTLSFLVRLIHVAPEPQSQVLPQLELASVTRIRLLIQGHPALDVLGGGAQNHALNAVLGHKIEAPLAATDDRLPRLHWQVAGTRYQGDLFKLIPPVRHRRRQRIVCALMREGRRVKRLHDDLELLLEQLTVGIGILHGRAKRFDLARMIPPPDPKDDPATRQDIRYGKILSESQGMPHGEHIEAAAEFELRGVLGQPETEHEEVRDAFIPLALEMVLGH